MSYLSNSFVDRYGLVNARPHEVACENAILFTIELYLLMILHRDIIANKELRNLAPDNHHREIVIDSDISKIEASIDFFIANVFVQKGLYGEKLFDPKGKKISHDQLTAIMSYFYIKGNKQNLLDIKNYIKDNNYTYNNQEPETFGNIVHPRDYLYLSMLLNGYSKNKYKLLDYMMLRGIRKTYKKRPTILDRFTNFFSFFPKQKLVYENINPYTFEKELSAFGSLVYFRYTDSKLLAFVRLLTMSYPYVDANKTELQDNAIASYDLFSNELKNNSTFGSWKKVFSIYFVQEHPINKFINDTNLLN